VANANASERAQGVVNVAVVATHAIVTRRPKPARVDQPVVTVFDRSLL
jgi:hypothetical protein